MYQIRIVFVSRWNGGQACVGAIDGEHGRCFGRTHERGLARHLPGCILLHPERDVLLVQSGRAQASRLRKDTPRTLALYWARRLCKALQVRGSHSQHVRPARD